MLFLTLLAAGAAVAWLIGRNRSTWRDHVRRGFGAAMIVAGLSHLGRPDPFLQHLPDWMPWPDAIVLVSGLVEIVLGVMMFGPARLRNRLGLALSAYLIGVFPANVYVALEGIDVQGQPDGPYAWIRLPMQGLFVFLAWWSTRIEGEEPEALRIAETRPLEHASG